MAGRRCLVGVLAAGVSAPRPDGVILSGMVPIVCRSGGGCKTPEVGKATGAGGGGEQDA